MGCLCVCLRPKISSQYNVMHWGDVQCTKCLTLVAAQPAAWSHRDPDPWNEAGACAGRATMAFAKYYTKQQLTTKQTALLMWWVQDRLWQQHWLHLLPFLGKKISSKLWNHRAKTGYKCVLVSLAHHQTPPPPPHQRVSVSLLLQIEKNGYDLVHILLHIAICRFLLSIDIDFKISRLSILKIFHKCVESCITEKLTILQFSFINCILYFVPTHKHNLTCVQQARLPLQCAATQPPTAAARWPTIMIVIVIMVMVMARYMKGLEMCCWRDANIVIASR